MQGSDPCTVFLINTHCLARVGDLLILGWAVFSGASGPLHMLFSLPEVPCQVSVLHMCPLLLRAGCSVTFCADPTAPVCVAVTVITPVLICRCIYLPPLLD